MKNYSALHTLYRNDEEVEVTITLSEKTLSGLEAAWSLLDSLSVIPKECEINVHAIGKPEETVLNSENEERYDTNVFRVLKAENGVDIEITIGDWISVWTPDLDDTVGDYFWDRDGCVTINIPLESISNQ